MRASTHTCAHAHLNTCPRTTYICTIGLIRLHMRTHTRTHTHARTQTPTPTIHHTHKHKHTSTHFRETPPPHLDVDLQKPLPLIWPRQWDVDPLLQACTQLHSITLTPRTHTHAHATNAPSPNLQVDLEQLLPLVRPRQWDVDPLLQAPPEGLINVPGKVGGSQDHHVLPLLALLAVAAVNLGGGVAGCVGVAGIG